MYSRVSYNGDGAITTFAVPFPYLDKTHIEVRVGGVLLTSGYSWSSSSAINISPAPVAGAFNVDIRRHTPRVDPNVSYSDGSTLTAGDLNEAETQLLYIAQEALDDAGSALGPSFFGSFDALGKLITNVGAPTSERDATPRSYVDQSQVAAAASASAAHTSAVSALASQVATAGSETRAALSATGAATSASTAAATLASSLLKSNNLSDLASAATARTNLSLDQVNNTSDASKPVSTATQTALNLKGDKSGTLAQFAATTSAQLLGVLSDKTGSGVAVFGTQPTLTKPNITGTATNDSAAAGSVGEYLTASTGAAGITNNTGFNGTSISLTAGDWDVSGSITYTGAAGCIPTSIYAAIFTTSATIGGDYNNISATLGTASTQRISSPVVRISLASTTTVYLTGLSQFSGGTQTAAGLIRARRVR